MMIRRIFVAVGFVWSVMLLASAGLAQECNGTSCTLRPVVASAVVTATAPVAKLHAAAAKRVTTWSPRRWLRRR